MSDDPPLNMAKRAGVFRKVLPLIVALIMGGVGVAGGLFILNPQAFASASAATQKRAEPEHETSYYALQQPFTSNLKDSAEFVQLSVSLGTTQDEKFVEALKTHEPALRSAVLMTVADQKYEILATQEGKRRLAIELRKQLNKALVARGEVGGIDTVYFTGFVVQ